MLRYRKIKKEVMTMQTKLVAGASTGATVLSNNIKSRIKTIRRFKTMYLLLLPALIYFAVFKYIPMAGIIIAFKNYNMALGLWDSPWVGLRNFKDFINGVYFWDIMGNTIVISLYKLLFGFSAPIVLALLLNEVTIQRFKRIVQTITYLPHFLSWVIV